MTAVKISGSWITAQADGTEHFVTEEAQSAGMGARRGWYEAFCQQVSYWPAAMEIAPRRRCRACAAELSARQVSRRNNLKPRRRLSRLLCPLKPPAGVGRDMTTSSDAPTSAGSTGPSAGAARGPLEAAPAGADGPARFRSSGMSGRGAA